jgi:membrane-associated phospholipid phosphatase
VDETVLLAVNGLRNPALDPLVSFLTEWGYFAYLAALAAYAATTKSRRDLESMRDGWLAFFVTIFLADTVIKPLVGRVRPSGVASLRDRLHVLGRIPPPSSLSFPSGTAAACACGAAWIWIRFGPRVGVPAVIVAMLLSMTRLYVGVHWPTDVLAGWVLGVAVALAIDRFSNYVAAR